MTEERDTIQTPADQGGGEQGTRDPEQIEREIEQTREEMGDTVAALGEKADVKKQAKDKVDEVKERVTGKTEEIKAKAQDASPPSIDTDQFAATAKDTASKPPAQLAGAFVAGFILGALFARRR